MTIDDTTASHFQPSRICSPAMPKDVFNTPARFMLHGNAVIDGIDDAAVLRTDIR